MKNVIAAADLSFDAISSFPSEVTNYSTFARMQTTFDLRSSEPCENSILRKPVGTKVAVLLENMHKTKVVGTIVKVNKVTAKVEYKLPNTGEVVEITINEDGKVRGETLIRSTTVLNYLEGHFEQMVEIEIFRKDQERRRNVARNEAARMLKEAQERVRHMSLEDAEAIVAFFGK